MESRSRQASITLYFLALCTGCPQNPFAPPPAMVELGIAPSQVMLASGRSTNLVASGRFDNGAIVEVTDLVIWTSSASDVASIDQAGKLRGLAPGAALVRATSGIFHASVDVQVLAPTPVGLQVSPQALTLNVGEQHQFTVTAMQFSDGSVGPAPLGIVWHSSAVALLAVDQAGLARALGAGNATLTASALGVAGAAQIGVEPPVDASLIVAPTSAQIAKGSTRTFTVTGTLRSDGSRGPAPQPITWRMVDPNVAAIDTQGVVTGRGLGSTTLAAEAAGLTGSAEVQVTAPVPVSLVIAPANASMVAGTTLQFSVAETLLSDGSLAPPPAQIEWQSSPPVVLSVDAAGLVVAHAVGEGEVTAIADGLTGIAAVAVLPPNLVSLVVTPQLLRVARGGIGHLRATGIYSDSTRSDLTDGAQWVSSDATVALIAGAGLIKTGPTLGSAKITATQAGVSGTATVTVEAVRVSFVTSSTGSGKLSSWPLAQSETGLRAADSICAGSALKGGLTGNFVAWMSDANDDAYCRIQGLGGKRATSCAQSVLPAAAGPWVRADGLPLVATLADLLAGKLVYPPRVDESGRLLPFGLYYTGTDESGARYTGGTTNCNEWTSDGFGNVSAPIGFTLGTVAWWTDLLRDSCDAPYHLLCFEIGTGTGPPVPDWRQNGKLAFVTSSTGTANLSSWPHAGGQQGLAAGDAICDHLAEASGHTGSAFKAWLSDDSHQALDRFTGQGPWVRTDGALFASSIADLRSDQNSTSLSTALSVDELGTVASPSRGVWTGTPLSTGAWVSSCANWTQSSNSLRGLAGDSGLASLLWSGGLGTDSTCDSSLRLYCFEQ